jgi:hypothetical protein
VRLTLFRRQWVEEERLTFPLVVLPFEMTQNAGSSGRAAPPVLAQPADVGRLHRGGLA